MALQNGISVVAFMSIVGLTLDESCNGLVLIFGVALVEAVQVDRVPSSFESDAARYHHCMPL